MACMSYMTNWNTCNHTRLWPGVPIQGFAHDARRCDLVESLPASVLGLLCAVRVMGLAVVMLFVTNHESHVEYSEPPPAAFT